MQREHDFEECSLHACWAVQLLRLSRKYPNRTVDAVAFLDIIH